MWRYEIDPAVDPDGEVPPDKIIGARQYEGGNPVGDFTPNPRYEPSAIAQMLAQQESPVLMGLARLVRNVGDAAEFWRQLSDSEIQVLASEDAQSVLVLDDGQGPVVHVFTDPAFVHPSHVDTVLTVRGSRLGELSTGLAGAVINPTVAGGVFLPERLVLAGLGTSS